MVLSRFAVIRNRCMLDAKIRVIQFYNNFQRETDYDYRTRTRYATSLNADWNRGLVAMCLGRVSSLPTARGTSMASNACEWMNQIDEHNIKNCTWIYMEDMYYPYVVILWLSYCVRWCVWRTEKHVTSDDRPGVSLYPFTQFFHRSGPHYSFAQYKTSSSFLRTRDPVAVHHQRQTYTSC